MFRIIVCTAALIAVIVGLRWVFSNTIDSWGLGWGALAVAVFLGVIFFIAHQIDRADSRSRREQPPERRDLL